MKYIALFFLLLSLSHCAQDKSLTPAIDKDKAIADLLKELTPQLTGTFQMKKVQVKYQSYTGHNEINIRKDTIIYDLATLTLAPAARQIDPYPTRYEGNIEYRAKVYPIRLDLVVGPWIYSQKGPKAYFLLDYNFPVGYSGQTEEEAYFLEKIGLLLENFALETATGTMTWHGLNRGIEQIDLIKK